MTTHLNLYKSFIMLCLKFFSKLYYMDGAKKAYFYWWLRCEVEYAMWEIALHSTLLWGQKPHDITCIIKILNAS